VSKRDTLAPEESVPLRLIVYGMTLTCILASCIFIKTPLPVTVLGVTLATVGSYVAFQYRHEKQSWMQGIVIVGVLGVGANALAEFMNPMNGVADFWGPVVHFVAGTFALHTFDLKSRSDINLSAMLGALILCCLSPVARSVYFGATVLTYITLGTMMLYFDCMSRTMTSWLDKPMRPAPVIPNGSNERRRPSGNAQLTMALLPLISLLAFLMVPRSDNTMDVIASTIRSMKMSNLLRLLPDFSPKDVKEPQRNPYQAPLHDMGAAPQPKRKDEKALKAPEQKRGSEKPVESKPNPNAKPGREASNKAEGMKEKPAGPGQDNANKDSKKRELEHKEENKGSGSEKDKEKKDGHDNQGKDNAGHAAKKESGGDKSGKDPKNGAAGGANANGKNASGKDGSGKDGKNGKGAGAGKGKGSSNGGAGGAGGGAGGGEGGFQLDDQSLNLDTQVFHKTGPVLFKVNSTRIFWSRRTAFDLFDGKIWTRSKDSMAAKNIDIQPLTSKPGTTVDPSTPTLSEEAEADRQLAEERLRESEGQLSGYGPTTAVHYVFHRGDKPTYDLSKANALLVSKDMPTVELTQSYEILEDMDNVISVCWIPQNLGYNGRTVTVDDYGLVRSSEPLKKGSVYNVVSQLPLYDTNHMRLEPALTSEEEGQLRNRLANYLQLPEGFDSELVNFANQAVGQTGNWFTQADKICEKLRTECALEPETDPEYVPAEDRVKQFLLERKKGQEADFASTFVLLCRSVGLPARVVGGFGPGQINKVSGWHEIRISDQATWAEVFIPSYGWVPFDCTPNGTLPAQKRDEGYNLTTIQKMVEANTGLNLTDEEGMSPRRIIGWIALIFTALIVLAGIVYGIILAIRHYRKDKVNNRWRGPEWKIYLAIIRDLRKMKIERVDSETSAQFVQRVRALIKDRVKQGMAVDRDLPDALSNFFVVYEAVHFGQKELMPDLKDKAAEVHKLARSKGK
jgi:hypothetical protein